MSEQEISQRASSGKVGRQCSHPFQTVNLNLDNKGPLSRSQNGKFHIISWVDTTKRYASAFAVSNKDSSTIVNTLNQSIVDYGFPKRIIYGKDNAFLARKVTNSTKTFGIELAANPADSKWMSDTLERFHGSLASVLCHYVGKKRDNLDDFLLYAVFAYGTAYQTRSGLSPVFLLCERDPNTAAASSLVIGSGILTRKTLHRGWSKPFSQLVDFMDQANCTDSWVMIKKTEKWKKLELRWAGLYEVISSSRVEVKYVLKNGRETTQSCFAKFHWRSF
jgi:hypothetical protein